MRLALHVVAAVALELLAVGYASRVVVNEEGMICPDDVTENCYPELFVPEEDWKPIKEGQIIPPGLQVRLSLNSDEREAKFVDNHKEKKVSGNANQGESYRRPVKQALAVVESETPLAKGIQYIQQQFKNGKIPRKLSYGEIMDHLTTLEEASSEIESGVAISKALQSLLHLTGLYDNDNVRSFGLTFRQLNKVKEMSYKILASAFRNNQEAQSELMHHITDQAGFLKRLVHHDDNSVVSKSRFGLLGSLLNNANFDAAYIEGGIERDLLKQYDVNTDSGVKSRILTILEDRQMEKREYVENEGIDLSGLPAEERYAKLLESQLIKSTLIGDTVTKELLNVLKAMKLRKNSVFRPSGPFLDWLSLEIEKAKGSPHKRDNNSQDIEELILLRHEVFGNRLGSRKDFDL